MQIVFDNLNDQIMANGKYNDEVLNEVEEWLGVNIQRNEKKDKKTIIESGMIPQCQYIADI